jgi:hypothetical protein
MAVTFSESRTGREIGAGFGAHAPRQRKEMTMREVKARCRFCGARVTYFGNVCVRCAPEHPEFEPEQVG